MYIEKVPNQYNKPAILLRESKRENGKIAKKTIANLSQLPPEALEKFKIALKGGVLVDLEKINEFIECQKTIPWGHVEAVFIVMDRLNIASLLEPMSGTEKKIIMGVIAARILNPRSKLATTRYWSNCALASRLKLERVDEDDVYKAMDCLLDHKKSIEAKLAKRHVKNGDLFMLDASSSYYEGEKSSLVHKNSKGELDEDNTPSSLIKRGYSRDKKRGKTQINYGLLTNRAGCPISIDVYPGNTSDTKMFWPTVEKIKKEFDLSKIVLVGDRGMICSKDIKKLKETQDIDWITALRSTSIKSMIEKSQMSTTFFEEQNLFEFTCPELYPGERLAACMNPALKKKREEKREDMIGATKKALDKIKVWSEKRKPKQKGGIGLAVGKIVNKYSMAKHFILDIKENTFDYSLNKENIEKEKLLDGIYIIRTSLPKEIMSISECVRQYKNLSQVERAFRSMKSCELRLRPIYHYLDKRIESHIFITMLAYYVEWHMREAWRELTFSDTELELKKQRDPVAPAERSESAKRKAGTKKSIENFEAQSFQSMMDNLAIISEVTYKLKDSRLKKEVEKKMIPSFSPLQKKAFELLEKVPMYP